MLREKQWWSISSLQAYLDCCKRVLSWRGFPLLPQPTSLINRLCFPSSPIYPNHPLTDNWTKTTSFCEWVGVSCSRRRQRVTTLNLSFMGIQGTVSPYIGNLSFLTILNLRNNSLRGDLPETLGRLHRLKVMDLTYNHLEGTCCAVNQFTPSYTQSQITHARRHNNLRDSTRVPTFSGGRVSLLWRNRYNSQFFSLNHQLSSLNQKHSV